MISEGFCRTAPPAAVPLLLIALSGLVQIAGAPLGDWLCYDRASIAAGEWWRLLSAHVVHLSPAHWAVNAAACALLAVLAPERLPATIWLARLLLLMLAVSLGLWLWLPALQRYVGLSGVLYGLFVLALFRSAMQGDPVAIACLVFIGARIVPPLVDRPSAATARWLGGPVIAEAHLFGIAGAAGWLLIETLLRRADTRNDKGRKGPAREGE